MKLTQENMLKVATNFIDTATQANPSIKDLYESLGFSESDIIEYSRLEIIFNHQLGIRYVDAKGLLLLDYKTLKTPLYIVTTLNHQPDKPYVLVLADWFVGSLDNFNNLEKVKSALRYIEVAEDGPIHNKSVDSILRNCFRMFDLSVS